MFKVFINEMIAHTNIDIIEGSGENSIPRYRDYILMIRGHKTEVKSNLLISIESYNDITDGQELLSAFEILKLSNPDNSLASPNALPLARDSASHTVQTLLLVLGHRNAIATIAVAVVCMVNIVAHKFREIWEASNTKEENKPSARAERLCRRFSLTEVQLATRNFSDGLLIGKGGFGKVYKGLIDNGQVFVAVKRLKPNSHQGAHEFLTEIETLSELRHVNLVPLIGYCNDHGEMILVYDYMAGGTLSDQLYKLSRESSNSSALTWKQRLNICIGAGRGLDYLHTGNGVIHRDVKTTNILLDENLVAKVSDFGLAKTEDRSNFHSHISTKVKGTYWYMDPHYHKTSKLTRKSDSYSFGVVLLEVLCGRPVLDSRAQGEERILPIWARSKISKGEVDQIVASSLREEISVDSLKTFVGVAERCLRDEPKNRPTMSQIVQQLELALEQHENKQPLVLNEIASASCSAEINQLGQPAITCTDVPEITPPLEEQRNRKVVGLPSGKKHGRKATVSKSLRLGPLDSLWNKFKPSKIESLLSDIKVTEFGWDSIVAATNHFSYSNIVGQGGSGTVYKAVFPSTGQLVAVKRFSPSSGQGLVEFRNEILLLPKLEHRNIIKMLGYCINRKEKLLVYEFMANTSLDSILYGVYKDALKFCRLQWSVRFKIITGIAQGLVYLHQDSGLRVIHRDLKLSNILLDFDMNPKISGFAIPTTLAEHRSEFEISGISGATGYMSPDYGFSVKSDVYGFGIIVLETVSGKRITGTTFFDYAWKLWYEGEALELVDKSVWGVFSADEALRCIQVGLLCTHQDPDHRPIMASVLKILQGEELEMEVQVPQIDDLASGSLRTEDGLENNATFDSNADHLLVQNML
ncbi:hypothetical protein ABFX02_08G077300 [Erythranthe guttata]